MQTMEINGEVYVRAADVSQVIGGRRVVVVDRGWIYAGDVERVDGPLGATLLLRRAVWVFRWEGCGFSAVVEDAANADIRPMPGPVEVPLSSVVYAVPVGDQWGL